MVGVCFEDLDMPWVGFELNSTDASVVKPLNPFTSWYFCFFLLRFEDFEDVVIAWSEIWAELTFIRQQVLIIWALPYH